MSRQRRVSLLDNLEQFVEEQEALSELYGEDDDDMDSSDEEDDFDVHEAADNFNTGGLDSGLGDANKDEMDIIDEDEALHQPAPLDYTTISSWSRLENELGYGWTGDADEPSSSDNSQRETHRASFSRAARPSIHSPIEPIDENPEETSRRATVGFSSDVRQRRTSHRRTNVSVYGKNAAKSDSAGRIGGSVSAALSSRASISGMMQRFKKTNFSTKRLSGRTSGATSSGESNSFHSMHIAADALGRQSAQGGGSIADHVAAAAMVVAAGATQPKRSHVQFAVGDKVLAFLSFLNVTNKNDTNDNFSVKPVNKLGYPQGEGRTEAERQGPHSYIMCTIKEVHFDEDERYFTVVRADTGTEQRADTAWLEPIVDPDGIEAAMRAANQTAKAVADKAAQENKSCLSVCYEFFLGCICCPLGVARIMVPWFRRFRAIAKKQIMDLLFGNPNYSCIFRVTGINILVLCSFVYLFIDSVPLAFFPADWDYGVAIVGAVVWAILVIELCLEYLIRPPSYAKDIEGDKAYAPSIARNINSYHLIFESIALILYVPAFRCLYTKDCSARDPFLNLDSALDAVDSQSVALAILGRFSLGITSLRLFGLVRHWKQMWINNTFSERNSSGYMLSKMFMLEYEGRETDSSKDNEDTTRVDDVSPKSKATTEEDQRLKNAATIGTALMVVTSHRALFLLTIIVTVLPMLISYRQQNHLAPELADLLFKNNCNAITNWPDDCEYLEVAIKSWVRAAAYVQPGSAFVNEDTYVLWAQVLPVRCPFQDESGVITNCEKHLEGVDVNSISACEIWNRTATNAESVSREYFAEQLNLRVGGISRVFRNSTGNASFIYSEEGWNPEHYDVLWKPEPFTVTVFVNQNFTVTYTNMALFILLASILLLAFVGLTTLRDDAGRLVLDPLRRMLKIVVRYAENPLSTTAPEGSKKRKSKDENGMDNENNDGKNDKNKEDELGNYETEQLINAVAKIADLLRKCWGVAGAGIISSNLARDEQGKTVVFNPTVPGKRVYALFGFVAINGFSKQLHVLGSQVMILINDVAKVVHDEVYRWALLDSGQCNKNLGAAFLMVFRIGDFKDVHDKLKRATTIVFKTQNKSSQRNNAKKRKGRGRGVKGSSARNLEEDTLQLASLPGIQAFTDRALLGMLKSFAGIHRDKKLRYWSKDFRLGAGVGAYHVDIIYGMDAGWAVEGAVGSEYKIDATYLSPHVNMASRMMSASKQYGVTILVSQAVEELLSKQARFKMRHLDTVYVKGSIVPQRVFTYDARYEGVDFFLLERTPEQADADAENYSTGVWENDPDLKAMRQHVTEEFMVKFKEGIEQYLYGDWKAAVESLAKADDLMIEAVLEEGYVDYDLDHMAKELFDRKTSNEEIARLRNEYGDGACKCLIHYMERRNCVAPKDWHGVRKLESK